MSYILFYLKKLEKYDIAHRFLSLIFIVLLCAIFILDRDRVGLLLLSRFGVTEMLNDNDYLFMLCE